MSVHCWCLSRACSSVNASRYLFQKTRSVFTTCPLSPVFNGIVSAEVLLFLCAKAARALSKAVTTSDTTGGLLGSAGLSSSTNLPLSSAPAVGVTVGPRRFSCLQRCVLPQQGGTGRNVHSHPIKWTGCPKIDFLSMALRFDFFFNFFNLALWCCACSAEHQNQTGWRTRAQVNVGEEQYIHNPNLVRTSFRGWLISVHTSLLKGMWSGVGNTNNHNCSMWSPLYLQAYSLGCIFLFRLHMCPVGQTPAQPSYNQHQVHTSAC